MKPHIRAWNIRTGKFVPIGQVKIKALRTGRLTADGYIITVGTNYNDSRGKQIFDGDIICSTEFPEWYGYLSYANGRFIVFRNGTIDQGLMKLLQRESSTLKIIGTVLESPELV